jgi:hypothetical protein
MDLLSPELRQACEDYRRYVGAIFRPAMSRLETNINRRQVSLHEVFGANLFAAHAIDYIQAIRRLDGITEARGELVRTFDGTFSVSGARFSNCKFELIDAINNALKQIRLDSKRYKELEQRYGPISFRSLVEEDGGVLCILVGYRFDYPRVVLRPAYQALANWEFDSADDVLAFARGEYGPVAPYDNAVMYSDDPADAIDKMIAYCNPVCEDCREDEHDCLCAEYVCKGEQGQFVSRFHPGFDFDGVMSRISGAYRRDR